ncbi:MAG: HAD-IA family hydrolase [Bacillota bacterium]
MRYSITLFDLDGTLIESGAGIFAATYAVIDEFKLPRPSEREMRKLVGPTLSVGFSELLGIRVEDIPRALDLYRRAYRENGYEALVHAFPGAKEMLQRVKASGSKIGIVTSRVESTAKEHLERYGLLDQVDYIRGATPSSWDSKTELLRAAIEDLGLNEKTLRDCVMIGDRLYDIDGANSVNMDSIAVTYGYGEREELENCRPTHIVQSIEELTRLLTRSE